MYNFPMLITFGHCKINRPIANDTVAMAFGTAMRGRHKLFKLITGFHFGTNTLEADTFRLGLL